jgi:hypothetical protein
VKPVRVAVEEVGAVAVVGPTYTLPVIPTTTFSAVSAIVFLLFEKVQDVVPGFPRAELHGSF